MSKLSSEEVEQLRKPLKEKQPQKKQIQKEHPQNKRQKIESHHDPDKSDACKKFNETLTIAEVNVDCLEKIFANLNFDDLLMVAETSKHFLQGARLAFTSKFGKKTFKLHCHSVHQNQPNQAMVGNDIIIYNPLTCLKVLRCFGPFIFKLDILYANISAAHRTKFDRYVIENCAESLIEIELHCAPKNAMGSLRVPFSNIQSVYFKECLFGQTLSNINKCFPKMRNLHLDHCRVIECIGKNFPNLVHLTVKNKRIVKKHVEKCLHLNPQLRSLSISGNFDLKFLRSVSEHPQLEDLGISLGSEFLINARCDPVYFENVRTLKLQLHWTKKTMPEIPISFSRLEEFTLKSYDFLMNQHFFDFINQHRTILKLHCHFLVRYTFSYIKCKLARKLTSVMELNIPNFVLTLNEVNEFLTECKFLKKFQFKFVDRNAYDVLLYQLDPEWKATIDHIGLVTLER